jgi:glutathione S-transferase
LKEAKIPHKKFHIDLKDKPEWYVPKVNPASKVRHCDQLHSLGLCGVMETYLQVPAVTYGGPDVHPSDPSPESAKITESLVLIQFFADLAPESDLLPKDALGKARIRFFLETVSSKIQPNLGRWALGSGSYDAFFEALDAIQDQLPPVEKGKYIFGEKFTLADISIAPFLGRTLLVQLRNGIGKFDKQEAKLGWEHFQGPKYERLRQYIDDVAARPSWQSTFDEVRGKAV